MVLSLRVWALCASLMEDVRQALDCASSTDGAFQWGSAPPPSRLVNLHSFASTMRPTMTLRLCCVGSCWFRLPVEARTSLDSARRHITLQRIQMHLNGEHSDCIG